LFQLKVRARLRFGPEAVLVALDNRAYWESFEEQPDGSVVVSFATPDLEGAASVVLRYGFPAVILEPEELRELVHERARVVAAHYASTDRTNE